MHQAHRCTAGPEANALHGPDAGCLQGRYLEVAACILPVLQHADHYVALGRAVHLEENTFMYGIKTCTCSAHLLS